MGQQNRRQFQVLVQSTETDYSHPETREGIGRSYRKTWNHIEISWRKNGPILFQLPPYSKQDLKLLEDFLTSTSKIGGRVFEFRHESWLNDPTYSTLEKHDADFCIAETEDMKPVFKVTGKTPYFRLRRESYDAKMIDDWTGKIKETSKGRESVYVYLRHDENGDNAARALKILESFA